MDEEKVARLPAGKMPSLAADAQSGCAPDRCPQEVAARP